jgi:hypothetical protein
LYSVFSLSAAQNFSRAKLQPPGNSGSWPTESFIWAVRQSARELTCFFLLFLNLFVCFLVLLFFLFIYFFSLFRSASVGLSAA